MKTILKNNDAINAYETIEGEINPIGCEYFVYDDCTQNLGYDSGTIVAFDNTTGIYFEDAFSNINDAIKWINQ